MADRNCTDILAGQSVGDYVSLDRAFEIRDDMIQIARNRAGIDGATQSEMREAQGEWLHGVLNDMLSAQSIPKADEFRDWLNHSIRAARFVPDALDPKAAEILENILTRYDRQPTPASHTALTDAIDTLSGIAQPSAGVLSIDQANALGVLIRHASDSRASPLTTERRDAVARIIDEVLVNAGVSANELIWSRPGVRSKIAINAADAIAALIAAPVSEGESA